MKNRILKWSMKKYTQRQRIIALIPESIFFLIGLPFLLFFLSRFIDAHFYLVKLRWGYLNFAIALIFGALGFFLSFWSVLIQFKIGKGTPAPLMATQKLIVEGPYTYCRNPMTLGTAMFYLGIGIWIGSLSFLGLTALIIGLLLAYVKLIEEKELEERFGQEYVEYKRKTPFLIPGKRKRYINQR